MNKLKSIINPIRGNRTEGEASPASEGSSTSPTGTTHPQRRGTLSGEGSHFTEAHSAGSPPTAPGASSGTEPSTGPKDSAIEGNLASGGSLSDNGPASAAAPGSQSGGMPPNVASGGPSVQPSVDPQGPLHSNPYNQSALDPRVDGSGSDRGATQHPSRDTALAGGAGAAGVGAYEEGKHIRHDAPEDAPAFATKAAPPGSAQSTQQATQQPIDSRPHPGSNTQTAGTPLGHHGDIPGSFPGEDYEPTALAGDKTMDSPHHHGRDAALTSGAGAAGAGAYETSKDTHHEQPATGPSAAAPSETSHLGKTSDAVQKDTGEPHKHYGRDAALAGGAGAAALGTQAHEHRREQARETTQDAAASYGKHPAAGTALPHRPGIAQSAAPATGAAATSSQQSRGVPRQESDHWGSNTAAALESAASDKQPQQGQHHHRGQDAAAAGGIGATGLGAYEVDKHHRTQDTTHATGHASDAADPNLSQHQYNQMPQPHAPKHHVGEDTAIAGGTGAAGVGTHEAYKRHESRPGGQHTSTAPEQQPISPANQSQIGQQLPATSAPSGTPGQPQGTQISSQRPQQQTQPQHHHGRDATVAGGAGAAGVGAYEVGKHHDQPQQEQSPVSPQSATQPAGYTPGRISGAGRPVGAYTSQSPQTTSPHENRPAAADSSPQAQQQQHHYGRDAALAVGAGTAGLGAYEAEKHHHQQQPAAAGAQPGTGSNAPTGVTGHTQGPSATTKDAPTAQQHHYGRDAALAGGAGTAGLGAYEAEKHHHHSSATSAQPGTAHTTATGHTQGPAAETRDAPTTQQHHYGHDAALAGGAGATGLGAYEAEKHHHPGATSTQPGTGSTAPSTVVASDQPTATQQQPVSPHSPQHHVRRDGALAGGAGAAGIGAYEADKHHKPHDSQQSTPTAATYPQQQMKSPTGSSPHHAQSQAQPQHHYGRDAAIAGGVGTTGVGAYEADRHHQHPRGDGAPSPTVAMGPGPETDIGVHKAGSPRAPSSESPASRSRKEETPPHQPHHYGRDAAGAGAAGVGAHELEKHHSDKHDKKAEKEEKKHQKEAEKHQKVAEKEAEKHQKEAEKQAKKEEKEKNPSLVHKILHPGHHHSKSRDNTPENDDPHSPAERDAAAAGAADVGAAEHHDGRHKLHKDPPGAHAAGPHRAQHASPLHGQYDQHGHAGLVTEPHTGVPTDADKYGTAHGGRATEPPTDWPLDEDRYGTGQGGTDAGAPVGGYHHQAAGGQAGSGSAGDWEATGKENTPY